MGASLSHRCATTIESAVVRHLTTMGATKGLAVAVRTVVTDEEYAESGTIVDHSPWTTILAACVSHAETIPGTQVCHTSLFNYERLRSDLSLREQLDAYCRTLKSVELSKLHDNEVAAICINAYNFFCVRLIIEHLDEKAGDGSDGETPLLPRSILDLGSGGVFGRSVWQKPAGILGELGTVTLDQIEHGILRKHFTPEPRFHAALVCASLGCPNLRAEAYEPGCLGAQMDEQAQQWVSNSSKGVSLTGHKMKISRIFLWFAVDFNVAARAAASPTGGPTPPQSNGAIYFIEKYLNGFSENSDLSMNEITYFTYDWSLNAPISSSSFISSATTEAAEEDLAVGSPGMS